jgi:Domain of unknown function (DUF2017)
LPVSFFHRGRVRRTRKGTYRLDIPEHEREVLRRLLPQLRTLLADDGPPDDRTRRLFPPAYTDDDAADAEYQRYMREELVSSHQAALDAVEASLDASELTEEQLVAWMGAVNSVRLVLGTLLDVSEELEIGVLPDDAADVESYALYAYLSNLLGEMVDAVNP